MENTELIHWGIKDMHWGIRRYQNKDGSLTPAGRKRYSKSNRNSEADTEINKESYEEGKARALKSGSATDVLKYKGDLSSKELEDALQRIRKENELKKISDEEIAAGKDKADRIFNKMGKVTDYAVTAAKTWNMAANIVNAFGNVPVQLPKVDTNIANGNRQQRKEEKKAKAETEAAEKEKQKLEEAAEKQAKADAKAADKQAKAEKQAAKAEAKAAKQEARAEAKAEKQAEKEAKQAEKAEAKAAKEAKEQEAPTVKAEKVKPEKKPIWEDAGPIYDADYTEIVDNPVTVVGKDYVNNSDFWKRFK